MLYIGNDFDSTEYLVDNENTFEQMLVTAVSGTTITVKRGYGESTRYNHTEAGEADIQDIYFTNRSKNIVTDKIPVYKDIDRMKNNFENNNVHASFGMSVGNGEEMYNTLEEMTSIFVFEAAQLLP